ncbi:MAG TPA: hypothetical protein VGS41_10965, partial [Chthonomonadales bacterium]|nr:hypothetical protein [Chthonomonadales bacterium]
RAGTTVDGDVLRGKALDPRATAYAVAEVVRAMETPRCAALFVMAEECAMDIARKAVAYLAVGAPSLRLIVNADVPGIRNLGEGRLDTPAIRIFEGRNFIDPAFGIQVADAMARKGVQFHLTGARSGSQTSLFAPMAPTLSIALPSSDMHLPAVNMSLIGIERCIALMHSIGRAALAKESPFNQ